MIANKLLSKLLLVLGIFHSTISFSQCEKKGITTDPENRDNPELPIKSDFYFDWTQDDYDVDLNYVNTSSIYSPFSPNLVNNNNILHFIDNQDMMPEDGWEIITYDLGYEDDGTLRAQKGDLAYLVFYNKYRSILRVFAAGLRYQDYNGVEITISVTERGGDPLPALLNRPEGFVGLDEYFFEEIAAPANFINGTHNWFFGDFYLTYDPCVCNYESFFDVEISYISNSDISLTGDITGTITSIVNKQGQAKNGFSFKARDVLENGQKVYKAYEGTEKFLNNIQDRIDGSEEDDDEIKFNLESIFDNLLGGNFVGAALKTLPFLSSAFKFEDLFVTGGKKEKSSSVPAPMTIEAEVNLTGNITTENPYPPIVFYTPNSANSVFNNRLYPFYNEGLGVFNLINTPIVEKCKGTWNYFGDNGYYEFFRLASDLKFVINPASDLYIKEEGDILAQMVFKDDEGNVIRNEYSDAPFNFENQEYFSLRCLKGTIYTFGEPPIIVTETGAGREELYTPWSYNSEQLPAVVEVKLLIYFTRIDDPEAQKVLHVVSYKTNMSNVSTFYDYDRDVNRDGHTIKDDFINGNYYGISHFSSIETIDIGNESNPITMVSDPNGGVQGYNPAKISTGQTIDIGLGTDIYPNIDFIIREVGFCESESLDLKAGPEEIESFCSSSEYIEAHTYQEGEGSGKRYISNYHKQIPDTELDIYPNPAQDMVYVRGLPENASISNLLIRDISGRVVTSLSSGFIPETTDYFSVDVSSLSAGVYFLNIQTERGIYTGRIVKN